MLLRPATSVATSKNDTTMRSSTARESFTMLVVLLDTYMASKSYSATSDSAVSFILARTMEEATVKWNCASSLALRDQAKKHFEGKVPARPDKPNAK